MIVRKIDLIDPGREADTRRRRLSGLLVCCLLIAAGLPGRSENAGGARRELFVFSDAHVFWRTLAADPSRDRAEAGLVPGPAGPALELRYTLGGQGEWAQFYLPVDPPADVRAYDHLRLHWRGSPGVSVDLEVGLDFADRSGHTARKILNFPRVAGRDWWGPLCFPLTLAGQNEAASVLLNAVFISVKQSDPGSCALRGSLAIDSLSLLKVASRRVPISPERAGRVPGAADKAAAWLANQQDKSGLVSSWPEETQALGPEADYAWLYDQALALLVFARACRWAEADRLAAAIISRQNADGSWYQGYHARSRTALPASREKWEGDMAWAILALRRYLDLGGKMGGAEPAIRSAAAWLACRVDPATGTIKRENGNELGTEGMLDLWWAFRCADPDYDRQAELVERCLMEERWDERMGCFRGGKDCWTPFLDNQTWGAAFLRAIGEDLKARRALSYAHEVLATRSRDGRLAGFDGQGPWAVWNEGTAQYVVAGGEGAEDYLKSLLAQQRKDGAMPGGPEAFSGGGVWITDWHGVAPTAWLYFALAGGPWSEGGISGN